MSLLYGLLRSLHTDTIPKESICRRVRISWTQNPKPSSYHFKNLPDHCPHPLNLVDLSFLTCPESSQFSSYDDITALTDEHEGLQSAAGAASVTCYMPSENIVYCMHPHVLVVAGSTVMLARLRAPKGTQLLAEKGEIEYTTFVTGAFPDWWFEKPNPIIATKDKKITLLDGGEKMIGVTTGLIAGSMEAVISSSEEFTKNQRIGIVEVEYTGKVLLNTFEEATEMRWTVIEKTTDTVLDEAVEAGKNGNMAGFCYGNILKLNFDGEGAGYFGEGMKCRDGSVEKQSLKDMLESSVTHSN